MPVDVPDFRHRTRVLRIVGGLIIASSSLGLLWPSAPMQLRETLAAGGSTLSDMMHIVLASVTILLMLLAIGFGAAAFGMRFRRYSIATLLILLAFGALTFLDAPRLQANLPTPWVGVWERINVGVFLAWVVVLATALLRNPRHGGRNGPPRCSGGIAVTRISTPFADTTRDYPLRAIGPGR